MIDPAFRDSVVQGPVQRLDPRLRLLAALAFGVVTISLRETAALAAALGLAVLLAAVAGLPWRPTLRKLAAMDAFVVMALALLPFTVPGEELFRLGPWPASREGLLQALAVAFKANAALLALLALAGTMEVSALGHALKHLKVPDALIHLLLLMVRYVDVLQREYGRLRLAMRARAFRPRSDRHTWRSLGYLVGMLLVRSVERSERVLAAMKCRGFDGHLHLVDEMAFGPPDAAFVVLFLAGLAGLVGLEALP
ncbi:MAG: cobalt ECF transporter T component CbiQ [Magnetospirillum sp. WYHS-4]